MLIKLEINLQNTPYRVNVTQFQLGNYLVLKAKVVEPS